MDKLTMAHEWFMKHGRNNSWMESDVVEAWKYTDAMQKEADSRKPKGLPQALSPEVTHLNNTLAAQKMVHGSDEWQPDWSQAPSPATHWSMTDYGTAKWHSISTKPLRDCGCAFGVENSLEWSAPTFGYEGYWKDSLRERP